MTEPKRRVLNHGASHEPGREGARQAPVSKVRRASAASPRAGRRGRRLPGLQMRQAEACSPSCWVSPSAPGIPEVNSHSKLFTDGQETLLCHYSNPNQARLHTEPISGLITLPLSR